MSLELLSAIPFMIGTVIGMIKPSLLKLGDYVPSRILVIVVGPFLSLAAPATVAVVKGALKPAPPAAVVIYKDVGPKMWKELSMQCESHINQRAWVLLAFNGGDQDALNLYGHDGDDAPTLVSATDKYWKNTVLKAYTERGVISKAVPLEKTLVWTSWRVERRDQNCLQVLEDIRYPTEDELVKFGEHRLALMGKGMKEHR